MKRMSCSLVLTAAIEAATSEVEGAKKREERAVQKSIEQSLNTNDGGSLAAEVPRENASKSAESRISEEKEKAFLRIWRTIAGWSTKVLHDAVEFAKGHEPRDLGTIQRLITGEAGKSEKLESDAVASKFAESVWPSLKSRGWNASIVTEGDAAGRTSYMYKDKEVS